MKIKALPFALATTIALGLCYSAWSYALLYWKKIMLEHIAAFMHIKSLRPLAGFIKVTWSNYIDGLTQIMLCGFFCALTIAILYNLMVNFMRKS